MGVNYGSGSGQQVVTAATGKEDSNSLWTVREAENGTKPCKTGQSFRCGDKIRLEHVPTGKNLHSSGSQKAPLSQRQEVSGFGDDGLGDSGDDWELLCNDKTEYGDVRTLGMPIRGKDSFYLKHVDTGCILVSESNFRYNN